MINEINGLIRKWRKEADLYRAQVDEARSAGSPHDQMLSMMTCLRQCARELEIILAKTQAKRHDLPVLKNNSEKVVDEKS